MGAYTLQKGGPLFHEATGLPNGAGGPQLQPTVIVCRASGLPAAAGLTATEHAAQEPFCCPKNGGPGEEKG